MIQKDMSEYVFMWSSPSSGAPIVSIATYGFTFNSSAIELMKNPIKILLGFDEVNKTVGIKPIYHDDQLDESMKNKAYNFNEIPERGYARISNKMFIKYISKKTGLDFIKAIKYIPDWYEPGRILIIDLNESIDNKEETEVEDE